MKCFGYLAAMVILHALARLSAGRAYSRLESKLFLWACRAHDRWVYRAYWARVPLAKGRKAQPPVVE